jgi:hypothetical protein
LNELDSMWGVGVNAQTIGLQKDPLSIDAGNVAAQDFSQLPAYLLFSLQQRAGLGARDQCAVGLVGSVGKGFFNDR